MQAACAKVCAVCKRHILNRLAVYYQLYRAQIQIQFGISNFERICWFTEIILPYSQTKLSRHSQMLRCNIACVRATVSIIVSVFVSKWNICVRTILCSVAWQGCVSVERCERETRKFCICVMFRDIQVTEEIHGGRGQGRGKRKTYWKEMADSLW